MLLLAWTCAKIHQTRFVQRLLIGVRYQLHRRWRFGSITTVGVTFSAPARFVAGDRYPPDAEALRPARRRQHAQPSPTNHRRSDSERRRTALRCGRRVDAYHGER